MYVESSRSCWLATVLLMPVSIDNGMENKLFAYSLYTTINVPYAYDIPMDLT